MTNRDIGRKLRVFLNSRSSNAFAGKGSPWNYVTALWLKNRIELLGREISLMVSFAVSTQHTSGTERWTHMMTAGTALTHSDAWLKTAESV